MTPGKHCLLALAVALVGSGCCRHLRYAAVQAVCPDNASRLERVYCGKFADYTLLERLVDPAHAISGVGIDPDENLLYIHRYGMTLFEWFRPTSIDTVELSTGRKVHTTRIPKRPDLSGEATSSLGPSVFDVDRQVAFVQSCSLGPGSQVLALDLSRDAPGLLYEGESIALPRNPEVDQQRVILRVKEVLDDVAVQYIDRDSRCLSTRCDLPDALRTREGDVRGGAGEFVLARSRDCQRDQCTLYVFQVRGTTLETASTRTLPAGRCLGDDAVDWLKGRWIVAETPTRPVIPVEGCLRVYEIPSLRAIGELNTGPVGHRALKCIPNDSLLLVAPRNLKNTLLVYSLDTLDEIARLDLGKCCYDDFGGWHPISDVDGYYVGAHGSHWVQLFTVRPEHAASANQKEAGPTSAARVGPAQ
jgi:hypothetical protein